MQYLLNTYRFTPIHTSVKVLLGSVLFFVLAFLFFQQNIFKFSFNLFLGLALAPFIFRKVGERGRLFYFFPAVLFLSLLLYGRSSSLYFFGLGFSILFLLESFWGRINVLPVFWWLVVSPLFRQLSNIWSFPIRLKLSEWAAGCLNFLGFDAYAVGNMIHFQGAAFSVDPACMGLNMIIVSLLLVLFLMGHFESKLQRNFSIFSVSGILLVTVLLTVLANFSRLLALVLFQIMPDNPLHELIGVLSLIGYVLVPMYFGLIFLGRRLAADRGGRVTDEQKGRDLTKVTERKETRVYVVICAALFALFVYTGRQFLQEEFETDMAFAKIELEGFEKSTATSGVLKMENEDLLIYIKPALNPLQGSHDPRYCWSGSGYEFKRIQEKVIGDNKVFTAELISGNDRLFTAWWFDNGETKTIDEWTWRWRTIRGSDGFRLINVSAGEREKLTKGISKLLSNHIFSDGTN